MLVQNLIDLINLGVKTYDEYDPTVLIPYINYGMDELSLELAAAGDPEFCVTLMITSGLPVPTEFVQFIPKNGFPVYIQNDIFITTNGGSVTIKYARTKPWISAVADTVPFKQHCIGALVDKIKSRLHADKTLKYVVENPAVDQYIEQRNKAALIKAKGG